MSVFHKVKSKLYHAICVVLALGIIVFSANILSISIKEWSGHTQNQILKNLFSLEVNPVQVPNLIEDKDTFSLLGKYVVAMVDSFIRFEEQPHFDIAIFTNIHNALPANVTIDSFTFSNNQLTISCYSADLESVSQFVSALKDTDYFKTIEDSGLRFDTVYGYMTDITLAL